MSELATCKAVVDRLTGAENMKQARFRDCSAEKTVKMFLFIEESNIRFTPGSKSLARLTAMVSHANTSLLAIKPLFQREHQKLVPINS